MPSNKATTAYLNATVLVDQERKLTPDDRRSVRAHLDRRWGHLPAASREEALVDGAGLLAHYGWPADVTARVVRLIAFGRHHEDRSGE